MAENEIVLNMQKKAPSKTKFKTKLEEIEIIQQHKSERKDMEIYEKFKKKELEKSERNAKKQRLRKDGQLDKRAITNPQNIQKATEKVKAYMQLSKQVLDEDTDEEYIDVIVKKKPKKPVVYKDMNIIKEADIILEDKKQCGGELPIAKEEPKPIVIEAKPIIKEIEKPKTTYRTSFTSSLSEIDSLRRNVLIKF
jgi:hypothetical protein